MRVVDYLTGSLREKNVFRKTLWAGRGKAMGTMGKGNEGKLKNDGGSALPGFADFNHLGSCIQGDVDHHVVGKLFERRLNLFEAGVGRWGQLGLGSENLFS